MTALLAPLLPLLDAGAGAASSSAICGRTATPSKAELSSTTGITKTSVNVGNVSIISGPVPGLFQGAPYGAEAYFAYLNAKGGVNGRKINISALDDGFSGTQNQALTKQIAANDFAMVGSFSLFDNYGCSVLAQNPAVPDVSVSLDATTNALPNVFSPQPVAQGAPLAGYLYLKKKYPSSVTHVAALVSNVQTALAQFAGQKAAMQHAGYKFVYVREVSPFESNFTTDVVNMRNAGVKFVLMTAGDWNVFAALSAAMAKQNFHPQVVMSTGPIYDPHYIPGAGTSAVNGQWLIQDLALYLGQDSKSVPAVGTFNTWLQKVHPGAKADLFTVFGWASAQLFAQALKAAGPNPTRGSVLAQLHKITSFSASGLVAPANPAKKIPPNCVLFAKISNGQFGRVDPTPKSGWDCSQPYYSIHGVMPKVNP